MKSPQRRRWIAPGPTVFASTVRRPSRTSSSASGMRRSAAPSTTGQNHRGRDHGDDQRRITWGAYAGAPHDRRFRVSESCPQRLSARISACARRVQPVRVSACRRAQGPSQEEYRGKPKCAGQDEVLVAGAAPEKPETEENEERRDQPEHPSAQADARSYPKAEIARCRPVKTTHRHRTSVIRSRNANPGADTPADSFGAALATWW